MFGVTSFTGFSAAADGQTVSPGGVPGGMAPAEGMSPQLPLSFPPAPSLPTPVSGVAATHREGGGTAVLPATLGGILNSERKPPVGFGELLAELGADPGDSTEDFCHIPEAEISQALDGLIVEECTLTSMKKASLVRYVRSIFSSMGFNPPGLGSAQARQPDGQSASSSGEPPALKGAPPLELIPAGAVTLSQAIDQKLQGQVPLVTFTELAALRANFERVTGAAPPEQYLPTGEQLSALRGLLSSGRVPYVDFAVWSALGPRMAKFRKTEATIFSAGAFVTRTVDGPGSFAEWEASWGLFSVAMVTLGAATPGTMQTYLAGMRTLLQYFPSRWGQLLSADMVIRTERWTRLREDFERAPPSTFSRDRPWDAVIAASAYGVAGPNQMWWETHFMVPTMLNVTVPSTTGMPGSGGTGSGGNARDRRLASMSAKPPSDAQEVCSNWNGRSGNCKTDGPCINGRQHRCSICGGAHRAVDFHQTAPKGKGKGKKGKGKGKKGQGKGHDQNSEAQA